MTLEEYQEKAITTAQFDEFIGDAYLSLGLCGEVAEAIEKAEEFQMNGTNKELKADVIKEFGDVMWYCAVWMHRHGFKFDALLLDNFEEESLCELDFEYIILAMIKQAGEVAEATKKAYRDSFTSMQNGCFPLDKKERIRLAIHKVVSCIRYLSNMAQTEDFNFDLVLERNIEKLFSRKERGKITGDGDNR